MNGMIGLLRNLKKSNTVYRKSYDHASSGRAKLYLLGRGGGAWHRGSAHASHSASPQLDSWHFHEFD